MTDDAVASAVDRLMAQARDDLERLVAIPSVASEERLPVPAGREAAELVERLYRDLGVDDIRLLDADDGSVVVVGRTAGPAGAPRVLLYAHYDVQPRPGTRTRGPVTRGPSPNGTAAGTREERRTARGNLVMHLTALRALRDVDGGWPVSLTVVCEGSEEMSTGGLERLVAAQPELFVADVIVVADTGNVEAGVPTVTTSLRGTGSVLVTVRTLEGPVHRRLRGARRPMPWPRDRGPRHAARRRRCHDSAGGVPSDGSGPAPPTQWSGSVRTRAFSTGWTSSAEGPSRTPCGRGRWRRSSPSRDPPSRM